jgi:ABC-type multidrug transport system fused ATPase/permease subunit
MSLWQIIRRLIPFVKPYRRWVIFSLGLTLMGAFAAQVNPVVLRYTVDTIERLLREGRTASQGTSLLLLISAILLGKEILNTLLRYGQNLFGEKIRVNVSSRLSQFAVEKILTYRLAFYSDSDNQTGILQTRIDRGAESLTKLVQSAFIDILPLFANAILALIIMFLANVYVGLVAAAILPIYFLLSQRQASMLKGARRGLRALREEKNNGLHNIIEAIIVIKSFVREEYEKEKQVRLQQNLVNAQLKQRQTNFIFDGLKTFVEQIKNSLDAIKEDRTTVVISHSISQIIDADIIFVLKEGRVVEHGTHEELYDRDGTYREIFNASARSLNIDKISRTLDVDLAPDLAN